MSFPAQIAKQLREVFYGGNWTSSSLTEHLAGVTWQQATTKIDSFNTIAALIYHIDYYVEAVVKVLQGEPLNAHDIYSFDHPAIVSAQDWENLLAKMWSDVEHFATLIEQLPEEKLLEDFAEKRYRNYYWNLHGIVQHTHYHLGQIVFLKKMMTARQTAG